MSNESKFKVGNIIKISDLVEKKVQEIPESDVTIQDGGYLLQLFYEEREGKRDKVIIKPGCYAIRKGGFGNIELKNFHLRKNILLESIDNTSAILGEVDKFFSKLDVYKQLGKEPKRAVLICSPPGVGKTAAITKACSKLLIEPGTAVLIWDTSDLSPGVVNKLFLQHSKFHPSTKKLILIMEDIDGGAIEEHNGVKTADSSLLNLLDGVGSPFQGVPTFIIATTNNPEQSVGALIDRPGRFDKVIEMKTPDERQSTELLKFIAKRNLTKEEVEAAKLAAKNNFSIAHLQEVVVRSMIDDKTMLQVVEELAEHKKRFKNSFKDTKYIGI